MADITACLQPSESDVWATPGWLYDALHKEFGFTLDPCSDGKNSKCKRFYTPTENGLLRSWGTETVFMNPPYSEIDEWMRKAYGAAQEGATVVCLIPSRTDTAWWHEYVMKGEVRLLRGRLKFGDAENCAPFPSAIAVFRPKEFKLVSTAEEVMALPERPYMQMDCPKCHTTINVYNYPKFEKQEPNGT